MKKIFLLSIALGGMWLSSCSSLDDTTPVYMLPGRSNDPPGMDAARKAERLKRQKEGIYPIGSSVKIANEKTFFFHRNPDIDEITTGRMVKASEAKILACEGLYYFVETPKGERGFVRETDIVNPNAGFIGMENLTGIEGLQLEDGLAGGSGVLTLPPGQTLPPTTDGSGSGGIFPGVNPPLPLSPEDIGPVNAGGRPVDLVTKDTEKGEEFAKKQEELKGGGSTPAPTRPKPSPSPSLPPSSLDTSSFPDLPTPSAEL